MKLPDVEVSHCATVTLLHAYSTRARDWLHRSAPQHLSYVGGSLALDQRSAAELAADMRLAGMRVE